MLASIKKHIANFILGILTLVIGAVGTILWGLNAAQATTAERTNGLEKQMEVLRKENTDAHTKIMDILMKGKP